MADTPVEAAPAEAPPAGEVATEVVTEIVPGQTTTAGEDTHAEELALEGEATPEPQQQGLFSINNILFWVVAALWIWYFFGSKKRKEARAKERKERERRSALQKGDNVVTIGRMHGSVVAFTDTTVTIKPDVKADYTMTFERQAIYRVLPRPGEEDTETAEEQQ